MQAIAAPIQALPGSRAASTAGGKDPLSTHDLESMPDTESVRLALAARGTTAATTPLAPLPAPFVDLVRQRMSEHASASGAQRAQFTSEGAELIAARASLEKDRADYERLSRSHGRNYEVDYGTVSIPAFDALARTDKELAQTSAEMAQNGEGFRELDVRAQAFAQLAKRLGP